MRKTLFTVVMTLCVAAVASVASSVAKNSTNPIAPDIEIQGTISDSKCGANHSTDSDEDKACVARCLKGGLNAVLVSSGGEIYKLDQQDKAKEFAGEHVKVTGSVSDHSISVTSIEKR